MSDRHPCPPWARVSFTGHLDIKKHAQDRQGILRMELLIQLSVNRGVE